MGASLPPAFSLVVELFSFILEQAWITLVNIEFDYQEDQLLMCYKSQGLPQFDVTKLNHFDPWN